MSDGYEILAEKYGYPGSERLKKILKRLMDEEEAEIVASLPSPVADLARKLDKTEDDVNKRLGGLFGKGVVFMTSKGYRPARDILQLHDATASDVRLDYIWGRELLDLWEHFCEAELYPGWAKGIQALEAPVWRIIPARKAVSAGTKLVPSEDLEVMLGKATRFAVVRCSCRRIAGRCDSPLEVCLQLNRAAEYAMARGTGKELTREEALEVLDVAAEAGLIHSVYTGVEVSNVICNCCNDCCVFYYPLLKYGGLDKGVVKSSFRAKVDVASCTGCQTCVDRCPFEAIDMIKVSGEKKLKAQVNTDGCYGCGVCAVGCEAEAIKLVEVGPSGQSSV
ncbi:MAG: 4Fe-4S binding protein [Dehalococcoidia bacterium]|nr:4Fe-4S binding protein [Dehalococcoidia bacterium]